MHIAHKPFGPSIDRVRKTMIIISALLFDSPQDHIRGMRIVPSLPPKLIVDGVPRDAWQLWVRWPGCRNLGW